MIEAAPASLFRAGVFCRKAPRTSKLLIRFFLGQNQAIGVLAAETPLLWHTFDLPAEDVTRAVMGTYSTLWMQARYVGIGQPIDTVIVHGRPELDLGFNPESFREKTGARLIRHSTPDFNAGSAALGAAIASPLTESTGINLARGYRPTVPIKEIFPWGEVVLQGVLVAGVSMYLHGKSVELDTQLKTTEVELHSILWLKDQNQAKLEAEKKLVDERVKALTNFENSRVDWSAQLRTIGGHIPDSTLVTSFQGTCEVGDKGKSSIKNQMVVNFTTPLSDCWRDTAGNQRVHLRAAHGAHVEERLSDHRCLGSTNQEGSRGTQSDRFVQYRLQAWGSAQGRSGTEKIRPIRQERHVKSTKSRYSNGRATNHLTQRET